MLQLHVPNNAMEFNLPTSIPSREWKQIAEVIEDDEEKADEERLHTLF